MAKRFLLACGRLEEIEQVRDSIDYVQFTVVTEATIIHSIACSKTVQVFQAKIIGIS